MNTKLPGKWPCKCGAEMGLRSGSRATGHWRYECAACGAALSNSHSRDLGAKLLQADAQGARRRRPVQAGSAGQAAHAAPDRLDLTELSTARLPATSLPAAPPLRKKGSYEKNPRGLKGLSGC
jgi:hypothetical protein